MKLNLGTEKLISLALLASPVTLADFDYTHGKWVLNPSETVERRAKNLTLDEERRAKLTSEVSNAITYWELDGKNLVYTDNHGKVSSSPYETRAVDDDTFEMIFMLNGQQIGGAIRVEQSEMGFCATFMLDHSDVAGQINSHTDCYKRNES